jgi:hypothetical protein
LDDSLSEELKNENKMNDPIARCPHTRSRATLHQPTDRRICARAS